VEVKCSNTTVTVEGDAWDVLEKAKEIIQMDQPIGSPRYPIRKVAMIKAYKTLHPSLDLKTAKEHCEQILNFAT
jgi:hypothetical protein